MHSLIVGLALPLCAPLIPPLQINTPIVERFSSFVSILSLASRAACWKISQAVAVVMGYLGPTDLGDQTAWIAHGTGTLSDSFRTGAVEGEFPR